MLKSEVLDFSTKQLYSASYFEDDTIDTVRHQIAASMNSHPDRLFILVELTLPNDYYQKDPRRWESLFQRLSYNGQPLTQQIFQEYQTVYRSPQTNVQFSAYDKTEWMNMPESLQDIHSPVRDFSEFRIFGVDDVKSYVLPMNFNGPVVSKIAAANYPLPLTTTLLTTLYNPETIKRFVVIPYEEVAQNVVSVYYPFLRSSTPPRLNQEAITLLQKNSKLLNDLFALKVFEPTNTSVTRIRLYAKLVNTDLGSAIETRFEQIFYGLTLSEDIPYVGFFTSKSETSRHKFYVKDPNKKVPFVDMSMWNRWWSRKPIRNQPTLLFYNGTSKESFDRIAITEEDITITLYREDGNKEKISDMKKDAIKWLKSFDAVMSFVEKQDIESDRWEIQDIEFISKYSRLLEDIDPLRLNCISSIFDARDKQNGRFYLLRTDATNYGISSTEVKIIQMIKDGVATPKDISAELNISLEEAKGLLQQVQSKLEEDPKIADRGFRGYPSIELGTDAVKVSFVDNIERTLKYVNILRYIVGFPESSSLDAICPKRMETVRVETAIAPVEVFQVDSALEEQYSDLFGYLEEDDEVAKEEPVQIEEKSSQKIRTGEKQGSLYSYFKKRLEKFDPAGFDPKTEQGESYAKDCEQKRQPVILSTEDLDAWAGTDYDPQTYLKENQMIPTTNPDGLVICPEYWCMKDEIPLQEEQLQKEGGEIKCPVCGGKLRTSVTDNPLQYTIIKKPDGFNYPGFIDYESTKITKRLPCCYKKPQKEKKDQVDDKYYVVRENILQLKDLRISFLPKETIDALQLQESYELFKQYKRIQNGVSGFFRVGLGRPSQTLPELLNLKTKIASPRESVATVLKCSFLRTWKQLGETHLNSIENSLKKISPYDKDDLTRESLTKIISGIDEAFHKKELSIMEDLEYSSLFLNCDIFRIFTNSNSLGCVFYSPMVRPRNRGIIILQNENTLNIVSHVTRLSRGFQYKSNIFEIPFKKQTYVALERARNEACVTKVPSYDVALSAMKDILVASDQDTFAVVLDPFGRGQAFYISNHIILPFLPTPLPDIGMTKLAGYSSIQPDTIPKYDKVRSYLDIAKKFNDGFAWSEDLYNTEGKRVEILLKSGLRIPVYPEDGKKSEPTEVIETVNTIGEENLVFGKPSEELEREYKNISYQSEIYEFLLFELTNDIRNDYFDLRQTLQEISPKRTSVEPELKKWFERKVQFLNIAKPIDFISKIRTPCGQFKSKDKCSNSNLCSWDGKTCKVGVRDTIKKDTLFYRMLSTLVENSKIRGMVLDGRTSPFFSTVLYLELPNEMIVTDLDIVNISV